MRIAGVTFKTDFARQVITCEIFSSSLAANFLSFPFTLSTRANTVKNVDHETEKPPTPSGVSVFCSITMRCFNSPIFKAPPDKVPAMPKRSRGVVLFLHFRAHHRAPHIFQEWRCECLRAHRLHWHQSRIWLRFQRHL